MANIMTFLLSIQKKSLLQVWTEVQKPGDCWRLLGQVCLPDPTSHIFGRNSTFACSTPYSCREILALWWHPMFFWPLRSNLTLWKTWWTSLFLQRQLQFCCSNRCCPCPNSWPPPGPADFQGWPRDSDCYPLVNHLHGLLEKSIVYIMEVLMAKLHEKYGNKFQHTNNLMIFPLNGTSQTCLSGRYLSANWPLPNLPALI